MKYLVTYVFDLPHTAEFVITAPNKKEALSRARQALADGYFEGVGGDPDDTGYNERVYVGKACDATEATDYEEIIPVREGAGAS